MALPPSPSGAKLPRKPAKGPKKPPPKPGATARPEKLGAIHPELPPGFSMLIDPEVMRANLHAAYEEAWLATRAELGIDIFRYDVEVTSLVDAKNRVAVTAKGNVGAPTKFLERLLNIFRLNLNEIYDFNDELKSTQMRIVFYIRGGNLAKKSRDWPERGRIPLATNFYRIAAPIDVTRVYGMAERIFGALLDRKSATPIKYLSWEWTSVWSPDGFKQPPRKVKNPLAFQQSKGYRNYREFFEGEEGEEEILGDTE